MIISNIKTKDNILIINNYDHNIYINNKTNKTNKLSKINKFNKIIKVTKMI